MRRRFDLLLWGSFFVIALFYLVHLFAPALLFHQTLITMGASIHEIVNLIWMSIVMGMVLVALLARVPRHFVMHVLGERAGLRGMTRAACGGVLLDLCNHGILMIGAKLYERGASIGQVAAFLIASPWNSFSLTLILIALIGVWQTLLFILLSVIIAILSGLAFDGLVHAKILPPNPNRAPLAEDFHFWHETRRALSQTSYDARLFIDIVKDGWIESKMVLRWVFFGIVLASVVRVLLAPEIFADWFGPTLFGLFATLLAATAIEICSEGSTPLAGDLVNRAQAPGNGFVFLMAGASTDYTEIMILREATKTWKIPLYLPLITVPQILILGWLINFYAGG